jgi:hypothetical protein
MLEELFRSRKPNRPERPSFRPVLESLESREVPSCADVSAAFNQLPAALGNLEASLAARDTNGVNNNMGVIINDLILLKTGAPGFTTGDRLQIDSALFGDGIRLLYDGYNTYPFIPAQQFLNIVRVGAASAEQGAVDFFLTGLFPSSSGNCTLT